MTDPNRFDLDEATSPNSRTLARRLAAEMVQRNEIPNAEVIRKRIGEITKGEMKPSALTIQDEIRKWYAEEFWPTYHAMGSLPADSGVPAEVRNIFQASFQTMVVQLMAAAKAGFQSERDDFQKQIDEADRVVQDLQHSVSVRELRLAETHERYLAEMQAHAEAKERLAALAEEVRELNVKLHAAHEQQAGHEAELKEVRQSERVRADTQIEAAFIEGRRLLQEVDNLRLNIRSRDVTIDGLRGENRRLVLDHAKATADAAARTDELSATRVAHAKEVERMTAALRAAQAGAAQAERMKPTARPAAGKATTPPRRRRTTLHKPTRP